MIPLGTDAPLYHRPFATIGLIVANVAAFIAIGMPGGADVFAWEGWLLTYANGLHPTEWVTYNFVHFGLGHLLGNMLFLWIYGHVVEGKIGSVKFLALYLGIGVAGGLILQTCALGYVGFCVGAGGASLVVFGLLGVCVLWAPENEVSMVWIAYWGLFWHRFEVRLWVLGLWYVGWELLGFSLSSSKVGGHAGHLIGAIVGVGFAYWMVKQDRVDCEGWDLLTLMKKGKPQSTAFTRTFQRARVKAVMEPVPGRPAVSRIPVESLPAMLGKAVRSNLSSAGVTAYDEFRPHRPETTPELRQYEASLYRMLIREQRFKDAAKCLQTFVARYPDDSDRQRLCLATLLIEHLDRPKAALRTLKPVDSTELSDKRRGLMRKLQRKARRMIESGVLELASA